MDWNNLHVLLVVSREGSLAGAARALGVNHATISRRLASLEEEVGTRLVRRLARSTPLTEKGGQIVTLAVEMEERTKKIERLVNLRTDRISGSVRLSAPPAVLSETLMPELARVSEAHPDLRLELVAATEVTSIEGGEADIAIRLTEPLGLQNIVRKLGKITYGLYGAESHIRLPKEAWRFIGADRDMAQRPAQKWFFDFAAGRPFALLSKDLHVQKAAAAAGIGIALLPDRIADHSEHLVLVDTVEPPSLQAWLVMHPDVQNTPAIRIISEAISSVFRSHPIDLD